ncbi:NAD(P)-dependent oxidoreductase [Mucilaginibacter sp.]
MKLAVLGATGLTGRELVKQAIARNYQTTALVRHAADLSGDDLTIIEGNILDPDTIRKAIVNCDAVISVLGFTPKLFGKKSTDLYSKCAAVLVSSMAALKIKKLIFCTSAGVVDDPNEVWLYKHILKPLVLKQGYDDMLKAEGIIAASGLDWVVVRPSRLTNGPLTKQFRVSPKFRSKGGSAISRADVAYFILDQVTSNEWVHQTPTLTH